MFEAVQDETSELTWLRVNRFLKMIKAKYSCYRCGKTILVRWNEDERIFDGEFMADSSHVSELFQTYVVDDDRIVCMDCFHRIKR